MTEERRVEFRYLRAFRDPMADATAQGLATENMDGSHQSQNGDTRDEIRGPNPVGAN